MRWSQSNKYLVVINDIPIVSYVLPSFGGYAPIGWGNPPKDIVHFTMDASYEEVKMTLKHVLENNNCDNEVLDAYVLNLDPKATTKDLEDNIGCLGKISFKERAWSEE